MTGFGRSSNPMITTAGISRRVMSQRNVAPAVFYRGLEKSLGKLARQCEDNPGEPVSG
jgi:hypothetical protein